MTSPKFVEKHLTVNKVNLRYLSWGQENKPTIICLHGHTGQAHIWDEFAESLSSQFNILAFDQRGHGESSYATDGYERDRFVEDLDSIIEILGLSKVILVGLSMGGWHSLLYTAENHPEKVEKIVIVDIGPESSEKAKVFFADRQEPIMEFDSFNEVFNKDRKLNPWVTDENLKKDLLNRLKETKNGKWQWKADPNLIIPPLKDGTDQTLINRYWKSLEIIECPILEVRGLESPLLDEALKNKMIKVSNNLSWTDIPNAGHVVTVDQPKLFIEATRDFLIKQTNG
jgi:pimeloyl-ACP methyl ester carboxylesterase